LESRIARSRFSKAERRRERERERERGLRKETKKSGSAPNPETGVDFHRENIDGISEEQDLLISNTKKNRYQEAEVQ
jgi:hypothetical protein